NNKRELDQNPCFAGSVINKKVTFNTESISASQMRAGVFSGVHLDGFDPSSQVDFKAAYRHR
ncbi:hypothetical protein ILYODFUR_025963, partial [Ilyodon furcidens]